MSHTHTLPFHIVGRLEGYTLGHGGKIRRLLIETSEGVHSIKLSHGSRIELLRSILNKTIQQGSGLEVTGLQKVDKNGVVKRLKAKEIVPVFIETALEPPSVVQPDLLPVPQGNKTKILVCQKSDCCKRGSAQLQEAIEMAIANRHLTHQVCVKAVGCLKHCSKGPNIVIGKKNHRDVNIKDVDCLLNQHFAPCHEKIPAV
jgi:Thioredoxin-like [2Fe-2S] ferredoxin